MRRKIVLAVICFCLAGLGCESMGEKAKGGAVIGGLLGAGAGGIIGHQSGHGIEGAVIGAAVGAIGGGLIGNEMDKNAQKVNPNHLTLESIVNMAKQGMPDDAIIEEIKRTKSAYNLTAEIITYLKNNKVSDKVIDYMLSTAAPAK